MATNLVIILLLFGWFTPTYHVLKDDDTIYKEMNKLLLENQDLAVKIMDKAGKPLSITIRNDEERWYVHYVLSRDLVLNKGNTENTVEFKMSYETYKQLVSEHDRFGSLNAIEEMIKLWKGGAIDIDAHSMTQNIALFMIKHRDIRWIMEFLTN
ncbi:MAG: hypothetical protein ACE5K4_07120 [Candidatus Hydrothermarchaeota archaeon]